MMLFSSRSDLGAKPVSVVNAFLVVVSCSQSFMLVGWEKVMFLSP